jgi:hypothetical protein
MGLTTPHLKNKLFTKDHKKTITSGKKKIRHLKVRLILVFIFRLVRLETKIFSAAEIMSISQSLCQTEKLLSFLSLSSLCRINFHL